MPVSANNEYQSTDTHVPNAARYPKRSWRLLFSAYGVSGKSQPAHVRESIEGKPGSLLSFHYVSCFVPSLLNNKLIIYEQEEKRKKLL